MGGGGGGGLKQFNSFFPKLALSLCIGSVIHIYNQENNEKCVLISIRTHLAYIANAKKSFYIKQQFTVLKARAS